MSGFKDPFVTSLVKRAAANRKRIVLPGAIDERMLRAVAQVLQDGLTEVIFIGRRAEIDTRARVFGVDLSAATVVSLDDTARLNRHVPKLIELYQYKGMAEGKARKILKDISFFVAMMIVCKDTDGIVPGTAHTIAHMIRPALRVIKIRPDVKLVSGAFLMVSDDHFDVYSDCAVAIAPAAKQLADIAVVSAAAATQFGLEPKVAMLPYSTIDSGTGPTADLVREATALAKATAPEMAIDGPLQFDAAVVESMTAKKAPSSKVANQANTFIFPDLNAGNITHKAVQRISGALVIGPILQGLNAPVNDLSCGATVDDIISTVVITAIQTQG